MRVEWQLILNIRKGYWMLIVKAQPEDPGARVRYKAQAAAKAKEDMYKKGR